MKKSIVLGALALALLAGPAFAGDRAQPQTAPKLTVGEVDARVRENGYATVRSIELRRDGNYKVSALDADGKRSEFTVDGATGAFLQKKGGKVRDDDYDGDNDLKEKHAHR